MKTQITTIAAAVAFAMSTAASAQYWSSGSDSTIYQSGNHNTNDITQWGTQTSRVYQEGNNNSTVVSQDDVSGIATKFPGQ
ncbi:hypothetical protein [Vreelandella lionensis]|uniref:hypothetical protein n=1 Tax=Vreelandella lionensis TaxID=1144478 RepID=UPI001FB1D9BC|nr:hypothetical protein [Halomonas lionensis]